MLRPPMVSVECQVRFSLLHSPTGRLRKKEAAVKKKAAKVEKPIRHRKLHVLNLQYLDTYPNLKNLSRKMGESTVENSSGGFPEMGLCCPNGIQVKNDPLVRKRHPGEVAGVQCRQLELPNNSKRPDPGFRRDDESCFIRPRIFLTENSPGNFVPERHEFPCACPVFGFPAGVAVWVFTPDSSFSRRATLG